VKGLASDDEIADVNRLWSRLMEGDKGGLEGLYRHFAKELFQYGLSIVSDQDFVQECNIQKKPPESRLTEYIQTMVKRCRRRCSGNH